MTDNTSDKIRSVPSGLKKTLFEGFIEEALLTEAERCSLIAILSRLRPECSIDIGTCMGGSLSILSKYSKKVYTLDTDPCCCERLGPYFSNVEYITGKSQETLAPLLERIQSASEKLGFIFIDGGHEKEIVKTDINNLLTYRPIEPLYIIAHDSFNPDCRQGIEEANWADSPYVHFVELDFVTGEFYLHKKVYRKMWCGLALAILLPSPRKEKLKVSKNGEFLFQTVLRVSAHNTKNRKTLLSRLGQRVMGKLY